VGKNVHKDICESLKLFAKEVTPEFQNRQGEQDAWKAAVINVEIELEDIDTEPFNLIRERAPTKNQRAKNWIWWPVTLVGLTLSR